MKWARETREARQRFCAVPDYYSSKKKFANVHAFNPFPNKPWVLRVYSISLLKTLWEKEKLLTTSNFSFSHSVFYPFEDLSAIFFKFEIVVSKLFQFGRVQNKSFEKGLRIICLNCLKKICPPMILIYVATNLRLLNRLTGGCWADCPHYIYNGGQFRSSVDWFSRSEVILRTHREPAENFIPPPVP